MSAKWNIHIEILPDNRHSGNRLLPPVRILLQVGKVGEQTAGVLVLGSSGDIGPNSKDLGEQIVPLLLGEDGGRVSFLPDVSALLL